MMRYGLAFIFICIFITSCKGIRKFTSRNIEEKNVPAVIVNAFIKRAGLKPINKGVDSLEIRIWYPFDMSDSFPGLMERYYFDSVLRGEIYFFMNEQGKRVKSIPEISSMKVKKLFCKKFADKSMDSLIDNYNLWDIKDFNLNLVDSINKINPIDDLNSQMVLMEQATRNNYISVFITDPTHYYGLNRSMDDCAAIFEFVNRNLCLGSTDIKMVFDNNRDSIFSRFRKFP